MSWSTTDGSASVLVSPSSSSCLDAIFLRILLIIFPLRVFGRPGAQWILSGAANAPIWKIHDVVTQFICRLFIDQEHETNLWNLITQVHESPSTLYLSSCISRVPTISKQYSRATANSDTTIGLMEDWKVIQMIGFNKGFSILCLNCVLEPGCNKVCSVSQAHTWQKSNGNILFGKWFYQVPSMASTDRNHQEWQRDQPASEPWVSGSSEVLHCNLHPPQV